MKYPTIPRSEVVRGDILFTRVSFEENTPDYYAGHNPYDVISKARTDQRGNVSKMRPVIVLDNINGELYVAPLTTKHENEHDNEHQMELQHTENLPGDCRSFVEVSNVRRIPARNKPIPYITKIDNEDMNNLMNRCKERAETDYHFRREKHTHVFIPDRVSYEKSLQDKNYKRNGDTWRKDTHSIEFKGDMVTSKYDLSLEDVLRSEYPHSHFTMRTTATRTPCSPQIDLLVEDVRSRIRSNLQFRSTNELPNGIDAITKYGARNNRSQNIQINASTDHGAINELGNILLARYNINQDKLPEFVTWYEQEHGLEVINPVEIKTDFSHLRLTPSLTIDDLQIEQPQMQK